MEAANESQFGILPSSSNTKSAMRAMGCSSQRRMLFEPIFATQMPNKSILIYALQPNDKISMFKASLDDSGDIKQIRWQVYNEENVARSSKSPQIPRSNLMRLLAGKDFEV